MGDDPIADFDHEQTKVRSGTACGVQTVLDQLDDKRRAALAEAVASVKYRGSVIERVVKGWGHKLSQGSVQRHRRGECRCDR